MPTAGIAIQLYTLRNLTATDMTGTLDQLATIGYQAIEFAGYGNANPREIATALSGNGMRAIAAHVSIDRLESDLDTVLEEMDTINCDHIVAPWLQPERRDPALIGDLTTSLNSIAAQCHANGKKFSYHNHDFEFEPLETGTYFDYLVANTDSATVGFEIDMFWAVCAEVDPVALLEQVSGRCSLIHAKDMKAVTRDDAPVGQRILDWSRMIHAANMAGAEWYIVEQDFPDDAWQSARTGLQSLQQLLV